MRKSVKSINPCQSVIQASYDIIKANGGVPIAIGIKAGSIPCEQSFQF